MSLDIARRTMVTVFGLGFLKPASGTWGSTPPVAMVALLLWSGTAQQWVINAALGFVAVVFGVACVAFGRWAEEHYGGRDPRQVVADETAGQCLALLFIPWRLDGGGMWFNGGCLATAFIGFRFFDILKPPPARRAERLPAGWGILTDDLAAALYALVVTQVVARFVLP